MSLDIYLHSHEESEEVCVCECCGDKHFNKIYKLLFHENITHNLSKMADAAGIYDCMWRPNENGITIAKQIIEPLEKGIELLIKNPSMFFKYSPENMWGSYEGLIGSAYQYLQACKQFPDAKVEVNR